MVPNLDIMVPNGGSSGSGGSALTLTDGTHTVTSVAQIITVGATVGGATPNATLSINPLIAPSNLTFTVSPTGSDANLPLGPFATIQAAATQAGLYNWILGFKPTIQINDGTYAQSGIQLPILDNISGFGTVQGNVGTPANVVISDPGGNGVFYGGGNNCFWRFQGLSIDTGYGCFLPEVGAKFSLAPGTVFNWTDSTASGFSELAIIDTFSQFVAAGLTINVGASSINAITECDNYSNCVIDRNTINFPVGGTVATFAWFSLEAYSYVDYFSNTITGGPLTGPALFMFQASNIATDHGIATDLPGTISGSVIDISSTIINTSGNAGENFATQKSGLPTTANLDPGAWGFFFDSASGNIYIAYNNAGTIETTNVSTGGGIGANPTATAGPAAVNGTATTFIRSDGAPAVQLGTSSQKGIVQVDNTTITAAAGVVSVAASLALTGTPTAPTASAGDNTAQIATDAFVTTAVNNAISGVNPAVAVQVATTAAADTSGLTYANGVGGVGATLTGPNNTAVTIDGVTFTSVGQRLLVKNDTQSPSGAFNGIYVLTALQTSITGAIFTRALDYDQPSDINNTGAIPVTSGTANAGTSWLLTSSVVTVGISPLTFTQFTLNPTTLVTLNGAQALTNKDLTSATNTFPVKANTTFIVF